MAIFTARISISIKGGKEGKAWEGEEGAGLFDNVINGVCLPGNSNGSGSHRLTDVYAVIWAHGGCGEDIQRDGWAVTRQARGAQGQPTHYKGLLGMLIEGQRPESRPLSGTVRCLMPCEA